MAEPEKSIFDQLFEKLGYKPTTAEMHRGIDHVNDLIHNPSNGFERLAEDYNKTMGALEQAPDAEKEQLREQAGKQFASLTELAGTIGADREALSTYPKATNFHLAGPLVFARFVPTVHRWLDNHSIALPDSLWSDLPNVAGTLQQATDRAASAGVAPPPVTPAVADVSRYNPADGQKPGMNP